MVTSIFHARHADSNNIATIDNLIDTVIEL